MTDQDLVVIGAGPAGMSAAVTAAEHGASVTLIDEQSSPGGQVFRNLSGSSPRQRQILGSDYSEGLALVTELLSAPVTYHPSSTVWGIDNTGVVTFSKAAEPHQVRGRYVLVATGALERPVPIPGWTLPGVMTAGAAQILMKTSSLLPSNAVLAGSGPLLYLLAAQLIKAGTPPIALVETQTMSSYLRALRHIKGVFAGWRTLSKGLKFLQLIQEAGVKRYTGAFDLSVQGHDRADGLAFRVGSRQCSIGCENVLLHQGVVPNTQITRSLQLEHSWCDRQHCFRPNTDRWGQTSNPKVFVAGDGAGIAGAKAAECFGRLASVRILHLLNRIDHQLLNALAKAPTLELTRELPPRSFLDILYAPPKAILCPGDDVFICRCENVTAGTIRNLARAGCAGPNQAKAYSRVGMGNCQGRNCGLTVTELLAQESGHHKDEVGSFRIRTPLKPVSLQETAKLGKSTAETF